MESSIAVSNPLRAAAGGIVASSGGEATAGGPARPAGGFSARNLLSAVGTSFRMVPYRRRTAVEHAAVDEHAQLATTCSPLGLLRREYGRGVVGYFVLLRSLIVLNATIAICAFAVFGAAWPNVPRRTSISSAFIALYPSSARPAWLISAAVMLGVSLAATAAYPLLHTRCIVAQRGGDAALDESGSSGSGGGGGVLSSAPPSLRPPGTRRSSLFALFGGGDGGGPRMSSAEEGAPPSGGSHRNLAVDEDMGTDEDVRDDMASRSMTHAERRRRRCISALVFLLLIVVQGALTYGIYVGLAKDNGPVLAFIVALVNNALNFAGRFATKQLTHYEYHRRTTTHREADIAKLFVAKFANVIVLYVLRAYVAPEAAGAPTGVDSNDVVLLTCTATAAALANGTLPSGGGSGGAAALKCACPLAAMAWTFLWLLVFDTAFSVVVEPMTLYIHSRYQRCTATARGLSDLDIRAEFDVAEETVAILYRQLLILLGVPVFPLIAALGAVSLTLEYWCDRMKLVNLCRKSVLKVDAMNPRLIVACSILVVVIAAISYPQGLLFVAMRTNLTSCTFMDG